MKAPTHRLVAASVAVGAAAIANVPPEQAVALIAAAWVTAMLPDCAERGLGRRLPPIARVPLLAGLVAPLAAVGGPWMALFAAVAVMPLPHRGEVTHDPLVAGPLILAPIALLHPAGWLAVATDGLLLGYASHLLADGPTIYGLPFWPIRERIWLAPEGVRVRVGSGRESLLVFVIMIGLATYCARLAGLV